MSRPSLHTYDERMEQKFLAERVNYYDTCKATSSYNTGAKYRKTKRETTRVYKDNEFSDDEVTERYFYNGGRDVTDVTAAQNTSITSRFWLRLVSVARWTKSWFINVEDNVYKTPVTNRSASERGTTKNITSLSYKYKHNLTFSHIYM